MESERNTYYGVVGTTGYVLNARKVPVLYSSPEDAQSLALTFRECGNEAKVVMVTLSCDPVNCSRDQQDRSPTPAA